MGEAPSASVLLVDDDQGISTGLRRVLGYEGFQVRLAASGAEALERLSERRADLREFELLEVLMRHPNQVMSRQRLLRLVWGYDFPTGTNVVEVYVSYLRRKLEGPGERRPLHNVRSVGYVLRHARASIGSEASLR